MLNALLKLVAATLTLALFGLVAWAYINFGRPVLGIDGNLELVVVGTALWTVRDYLVKAATDVVGAVERVAKS